MNVFLVPRGREIYLVTGGYGSNGTSQNVLTWHKNFGGYFNSTSARSFTLPSAIPADEYRYDYVESNTFGYVYATGNTTPFKYLKLFRIAGPEVDSQNDPKPGGGSLYKFIALPTYSNPTAASWAKRVTVKNGNLVPYDAGCSNNPVNVLDQRCAQSFSIVDNNFSLGP
jgi:hypothetical protein